MIPNTIISLKLLLVTAICLSALSCASGTHVPPEGMVLIPAGPFQMGDPFGEGHPSERPVHTVYVDAFFMDRYPVTKALWDEVYHWATTEGGYVFNNQEDTNPGRGTGGDHPVHSVNWYNAVLWCNARSEMEGKTPAYYLSSDRAEVYRSGIVDIRSDWVKWNAGYRLPTEAEWEKAARGGREGLRFPWGNIIGHEQANFRATGAVFAYETPAEHTTPAYHPDYTRWPRTSPVGSFAPNDYGLFDVIGNLSEWCWDWWCREAYTPGHRDNPRGPTEQGIGRMVRGGSWSSDAGLCRLAARSFVAPETAAHHFGFRTVLPRSKYPPSPQGADRTTRPERYEVPVVSVQSKPGTPAAIVFMEGDVPARFRQITETVLMGRVTTDRIGSAFPFERPVPTGVEVDSHDSQLFKEEQ